MISPSHCAHKFSAVVVDHFPPGLHDQEMWLDCALSDHSPQTCPVWLDLPGVASHRYSSGGHRGTQASLPRQGNSPQGSPIVTFYELRVKRENEYKIVYKRMASSANISKLKTQLQTSNWEEVYKDQNPCTSYDTFLEILNTQMNECLPWKKFKMKTCKSKWLTKA